MENLLPHSLESERAVLGSILLDDKAYYRASQILEAGDFYDERHRIIYSVMTKMATEGRAIDMLTLYEELRLEGKAEKVPPEYLVSLTDTLPRSLNVEHYSATARDKASLRKLISAASEARDRAWQAETTPDEIIESLQPTLIQILQRGKSTSCRPISEIVDNVYREIEAASERRDGVSGLDTGLSEINRMLGGLKQGNLIIIAGRPGFGKTSFCLNVAAHAAIRRQLKVAIFSLEMGQEEVTRRILCSEAEVDSFRLSSGYANKEDWAKINYAAGLLSQAKIFIEEDPSISMLKLRSRAESLMLEHGLDLVIVDYLQLVSGSSQRRFDTRAQEVSEISRSLKALAKDLNLPVLAASQLNRSIESRSTRRPQLSDLRESGSIEQDADVVMFLYREDSSEESIIDVSIAKQRNGPTGKISLSFQGRMTKIGNLFT